MWEPESRLDEPGLPFIEVADCWSGSASTKRFKALHPHLLIVEPQGSTLSTVSQLISWKGNEIPTRSIIPRALVYFPFLSAGSLHASCKAALLSYACNTVVTALHIRGGLSDLAG